LREALATGLFFFLFSEEKQTFFQKKLSGLLQLPKWSLYLRPAFEKKRSLQQKRKEKRNQKSVAITLPAIKQSVLNFSEPTVR
jgi:hypothetical protein